jgi:hypothetical protein
MKLKHMALFVGTYCTINALSAAVIEESNYATFRAKLHLEGNKVFVDCDTLKIKDGSTGKLIPVKHIEADESNDINYIKIKQAAARNETKMVEGRFNTDQTGTYYFIVARSDGRR